MRVVSQALRSILLASLAAVAARSHASCATPPDVVSSAQPGGNPKTAGRPGSVSAVASALAVEPAPARVSETPPPACEEVAIQAGPWPRAVLGAAGLARVVRGSPGRFGHIEQRFETGQTARLRYLGAHLFDLLDKVMYEGGGGDDARRRTICAVLNAAASQGVPVLRIWGSLKRTGTPEEVRGAADMLELVLDENARRKRPLRFVIALLNHQAGYGSPRPDRSLDDQEPGDPWSARRMYLSDGFWAPRRGLPAERIRHYGERAAIQASPYVLGWELVNELDTFRGVAAGSLAGPEATTLRDAFLVPAMTLLAETFPQPLLVGDIRGAPRAYAGFTRGVAEAMPEKVRDRLVWTSHVYGVKSAGAGERGGAAAPNTTWKLDLDLDLAATLGMPFLLGEVGQHVRGVEAGFCRDGPRHDIRELFRAVFEDAPSAPHRSSIDAALFWGEGQCHLEVKGGSQVHRLSIGAGGDSAELGPNELEARAVVREARRLDRFRAGND